MSLKGARFHEQLKGLNTKIVFRIRALSSTGTHTNLHHYKAHRGFYYISLSSDAARHFTRVTAVEFFFFLFLRVLAARGGSTRGSRVQVVYLKGILETIFN